MPTRRGAARPGSISFILYARFAAGAAPARRTIGVYGAITLEDARRIAGEWRSLIAKGIDPAVVEAEAREKAAREAGTAHPAFVRATSPRAFITDKLAQERSGKAVERDLRSVFIAAWGDRPVSEITKFDVLEIINAKKRTAPQMARASAGPDQAVLQLVHRPARIRPDHVTMRPAEPGEDHRRAAAAQPTPHRRRAVRVLASHRAHEIPGRSGLPDAAAHRAAAQRVRASCRGRKFTATTSSSRHSG